MPLLRCYIALILTLHSVAQDAPRIVRLSPSNHSADVGAATTELVVEFDRPMGTGRSVVGGGRNFPRVRGAGWRDRRTFVIDVTLRPDHDYAIGLNGGRFSNFRCADGVALEPVRWSFTTLPAELPDEERQRARNAAALERLRALMPAKYSYYDRKIADWQATFTAGKPALLAARTDTVWAAEAARMLAPTEDIHLYLRAGERIFATGRRSVDPLFRRDLLRRYVEVRRAGRDHALWGRTDDDIGYLMIASWTSELDLDAIDRALEALRDCRAMVIDVRPNSGGSERLAQRVAAWFVAGKPAYAKNRYRERAGGEGFGPVLPRVLEGNTEPARQYRGPIAVLTSRYTMSSSESFVMMLQQAPDCTVVGQPTYGSSGNPKPHALGNDVTIVVPSWQDLRLDGTCIEGEGVAPDVVVAATAADLERRDPILERALALLRAR